MRSIQNGGWIASGDILFRFLLFDVFFRFDIVCVFDVFLNGFSFCTYFSLIVLLGFFEYNVGLLIEMEDVTIDFVLWIYFARGFYNGLVAYISNVLYVYRNGR